MEWKLIGVACAGFLLGSATVAFWPESTPVKGGRGTVVGPQTARDPVAAFPSAPKPSPRGMGALATLMEEPVADDGEIARYLEERGRSRESLIAVGLLTGDEDLLREAAQRFPEDPHVQFLALSNGLFPQQQREWTERFRNDQLDNSLAAYFMAGVLFKSGDTEAAIEELRRGAVLGNFRDFSNDGMLAMEAAALDLGSGGLEAKLQSTFALPLPYIRRFRETIGQLEKAAGSAASPQEAAEMAALGVAIGNDLSQGSGSQLIINQLVGMSIEKKFLGQLDPDARYEYFQGTPAELLASIEADTERIREDAGFMERAPGLDDTMVLHYLDRVRLTGEATAVEWLKARTKKDR